MLIAVNLENSINNIVPLIPFISIILVLLNIKRWNLKRRRCFMSRIDEETSYILSRIISLRTKQGEKAGKYLSEKQLSRVRQIDLLSFHAQQQQNAAFHEDDYTYLRILRYFPV